MNKLIRFIKEIFHRFAVLAGAVALTLIFFLVLPLMQQISQSRQATTTVQEFGMAPPPPPPPPPPEEEEEEEPEPEEEPELEDVAPPMDLAQLEMALNIGGTGFATSGDFGLDIKNIAGKTNALDGLISSSQLDQRPRVIYQPGPTIDGRMRRKLQRQPGTVYVIFVVNKKGRVENPKIQDSSDTTFNQAALNAVKQWKFEPGRRGGEPVRFRMKVPITFPKVDS